MYSSSWFSSMCDQGGCKEKSKLLNRCISYRSCARAQIWPHATANILSVCWHLHTGMARTPWRPLCWLHWFRVFAWLLRFWVPTTQLCSNVKQQWGTILIQVVNQILYKIYIKNIYKKHQINVQEDTIIRHSRIGSEIWQLLLCSNNDWSRKQQLQLLQALFILFMSFACEVNPKSLPLRCTRTVLGALLYRDNILIFLLNPSHFIPCILCHVTITPSSPRLLCTLIVLAHFQSSSPFALSLTKFNLTFRIQSQFLFYCQFFLTVLWSG